MRFSCDLIRPAPIPIMRIPSTTIFPTRFSFTKSFFSLRFAFELFGWKFTNVLVQEKTKKYLRSYFLYVQRKLSQLWDKNCAFFFNFTFEWIISLQNENINHFEHFTYRLYNTTSCFLEESLRWEFPSQFFIDVSSDIELHNDDIMTHDVVDRWETESFNHPSASVSINQVTNFCVEKISCATMSSRMPSLSI